MFELISRVELFEDLGVKLPTCRQETDRRLNLEQLRRNATRANEHVLEEKRPDVQW
jgi:hypothetical protein